MLIGIRRQNAPFGSFAKPRKSLALLYRSEFSPEDALIVNINPYQASYEFPDEAILGPERLCGGISRTGYFLSYIAIWLGESFLNFAAMRIAGPLAINLGTPIMLIASCGTSVISWYRMINQGNSGWWGVVSIVPVVNFFVFLRCVIYPEGYANHRTLDTAGKIIGGLILLFILLLVATVLLAWT